MNIVISNELTGKDVIIVPLMKGLPIIDGIGALKFIDNLDINKLSGKNNKGPIYYGYLNKPDSYVVGINISDSEETTYEDIRKAYGEMIRMDFPEYYDTISIIPPRIGNMDKEKILSSIIEGIKLGSYTFSKYKKEKKKPNRKICMYITDYIDEDQAKNSLKDSEIVCNAVNLARDLLNEPTDKLTPEIFASRVINELSGTQVKVEIIDEKKMEKKNINGVLAVGRGSTKPPRLALLHYFNSDKAPVIALLGKGLTIDTGGINLKTGRNLSGMRQDMGGAAAVLSAIKILNDLGVKANVIGIIPMVENTCDGGSYKPGEIIEYANGITVEVQNTDAEGRLVLADSIIIANDMKADIIIDIATLTGSCARALGSEIAGVLGTHSVVQSIIKEGLECGELFWEMPLYSGYRKTLDSNIADIGNLGDEEPGVITAALFLKEFVGETKWAHLDIAGTVSTSSSKGYLVKGGLGFGVRTLVSFVKNIASSSNSEC